MKLYREKNKKYFKEKNREYYQKHKDVWQMRYQKNKV